MKKPYHYKILMESHIIREYKTICIFRLAFFSFYTKQNFEFWGACLKAVYGRQEVNFPTLRCGKCYWPAPAQANLVCFQPVTQPDLEPAADLSYLLLTISQCPANTYHFSHSRILLCI